MNNKYKNNTIEELVKLLEIQEQELFMLQHQKESDKELRLLSFAVSQSSDEIYAFNSKGQFIFVNQRTIDNYLLEKPYTKYSITDINPYYDKEQIKNLVDMLRRQIRQIYETKHYLANGTIIPVEVYLYRVNNDYDGEIFWCFARDISERVQQREKINELNNLMETVLNNVPVAIFVKSVDNDFKHIYYNSAAEQITGIPSSKALGKTDFDIFTDLKIAKELRDNDLLALKEGEHAMYAAEYVTPKGEKKIVNSIRLLVNSEHTPLIISLIWDITDQRNNEIKLIKAEESDKLKSAFLANMSHEIRTPLNAIVGFSTILAETTDPEEQKSYIEIINNNNELLLRLINDILDFSKIESGTLDFFKEKIDIKDICQHVYLINSIKMKQDVSFIFDINNLPSISIYADSKRVSQVITNFISNAIKFTEKGFIQLSYELTSENEVRVTVSDTGIGIPEEYVESIFDRFIKVDEFRQGSGLGLSISKMVIEKMGGRIGVNTSYKNGSSFWFSIPTGMPLSNQITAKKKTILVAEDIEENFHLLNVLFSKQYDIYHAYTGIEAVNLFKTYHPDIILMDLKMPEMDGFTATRLIRELSDTVPIIALTAFNQASDRQMANDCHFNDYILKPIDISLLRKIVTTYT